LDPNPNFYFGFGFLKKIRIISDSDPQHCLPPSFAGLEGVARVRDAGGVALDL
jgi:hypothetical protein